MTISKKKILFFSALLTAGLFVMSFFSLPVNAAAYEIQIYITETDGGTVTFEGTEKTAGSAAYIDENSLGAFLIEAKDGYKVGTVKYSGGTLTKSGNLYTTPAVTSNATLYVTFEKVSTFEVQFDIGMEGWITDTSGMTLYEMQRVTEGESFSFKIGTIEGYGIKNITYSGAKITPNNEGVYKITPTASGTLSVSFDRYNTIDFVVGAEGIVKDTAGNIISGETIEVVHGMSFKFLVESDEGYGIKNINISYDDTIRKLTPNADGSYTIPSLDRNCTVYIDFQQTYALNIITPPKDCKITAKNGTELLPTGKQNILRGSTVKVSTSTETGTGYIFDHYLVTVAGDEKTYDSPEIEIIVAGNTDIEPIYKKVDTFNITIISSGGGVITQTGGYSPNQSNVRVNRGDRITFSIVPDANYKLESISYSGISFTQDGTNYTTESISDNQTLEVSFKGKSENVVGIEVTDIGTVVTLKNTESIADAIDDNNGNILRAPIGDGVITAETLYKLLGKSVWLDIYGDGYSWNINSHNVTGAEFTSKNLSVSLKDEYAPSNLRQLISYQDKKQVHIAEEGALSFSATFNVNMGEKNTGKTATIFAVNTEKYAVSSISSSVIDAEGNASFVLDSGGYYVIVISEAPITDADLAELANAGAVDTGTNQLILAAVMLVILLAIGGIIAYSMSKINGTK